MDDKQMQPANIQPAFIHYIELRAGDAQQQLRGLARLLSGQSGFIDGALLHSEAQGLWLLETRWAGQVPEVLLPAGAKAWVFAVREFTKKGE